MFDLLNYDPNVIEILKNKLYWTSTQAPPANSNYVYFSLDEELKYNPLNYDFGPVHLGKVYKFTRELLNILNGSKFSNVPLVYYTSLDFAKRANAAFLICAFQIIVFGRSADTVWAPFSKLQPELVAFRDASYTRECTYKCTILDCLRGLEYAIKLKWFDLGTFDHAEYEFYSEVENGDLNWVIPRKMIAFAGPFNRAIDAGGYQRMTPESYTPIFKKLDVGTIIRLNDKIYDEEKFKKEGFNHIDMIFPDGSCPSKEIITRFLEACEQELGAVAIHCKAGLGRTGTLIACYAIKHFKFSAADFIGWIRLCRPGSILGPQQQFLIDIEPYLHSLSEKSTIFQSISPIVKRFHSLRTKEERINYRLSHHEQMVAIHGESDQGDFLLEAKDRARRSCRVQSNQTVSIFNKSKSFVCPSSLIFEEEIPIETVKTVNRILLSRHESASRGTLTRQSKILV